MTSIHTRFPDEPAPLPPVAVGARPGGRLAGAVKARLHASGYLALREVSVESTGPVVVLRGRASSFYLKQVAQAAAGAVAGVRLVVNRIEVEKPASARQARWLDRPLGRQATSTIDR
jgi:hypothetical protein